MMEPECLFERLEMHLLQDAQPSIYLNKLYGELVISKYPWNMLKQLKETEQSPAHHPEGNVWIHTMLVVDEAARVREQSQNPKAFMWAALLHDIGKPHATRIRKGKITAYDHDKIGAKLADEFLKCFTDDRHLRETVCNLVRYHMQILFVVKRMPFADIMGMKRDTDIREIAMLGLCDRLGRGTGRRREEEKNIFKFMELCEAQAEEE